MPAISFMLGYYVLPSQLQEMEWTDLNLRGNTALLRDPKGAPARTAELTQLLVQQLMPLFRQKVRARRPFGKVSAGAPTISQLLKSVLVHAGLKQYTPADFTAWSLSQSDTVRGSLVTACIY
jgi:hypothetical protein